MDEVNEVLNFLNDITMRSGGFVLALCAITVILALAKGWLYGPRYVKLVESLLAEANAKITMLDNQQKGTK